MKRFNFWLRLDLFASACMLAAIAGTWASGSLNADQKLFLALAAILAVGIAIPVAVSALCSKSGKGENRK